MVAIRESCAGRRLQLFFSAHDESEGVMCLGRSTSRSPFGPFVDVSGVPFLCQVSAGGSIDPSVYRSEGTDYLVGKLMARAGNRRRYSPPRLTPDDSELVGQPDTLLHANLSCEGYGWSSARVFTDASVVLDL